MQIDPKPANPLSAASGVLAKVVLSTLLVIGLAILAWQRIAPRLPATPPANEDWSQLADLELATRLQRMASQPDGLTRVIRLLSSADPRVGAAADTALQRYLARVLMLPAKASLPKTDSLAALLASSAAELSPAGQRSARRLAEQLLCAAGLTGNRAALWLHCQEILDATTPSRRQLQAASAPPDTDPSAPDLVGQKPDAEHTPPR